MQGQVKMCDFGISGYLVDSVAKTMDAGCKPYMAVRKTKEEMHILLSYAVTSIFLCASLWSINDSMQYVEKNSTLITYYFLFILVYIMYIHNNIYIFFILSV